MDSYKEPVQPELVELAPAPIIWCTGFRLSKTRNPHFVEYILFCDVEPLRDDERAERQVVARIVAPIEIIDPVRRAALEREAVVMETTVRQ